MKARIILTGILFAVFCTVSLSYGDVPQMITYQGKLTTPPGGLVDTTVAMTFSIYADEAGATLLWSEQHPAVQVDKSIFNILLGSVNPLPDTVFTSDVRYLGIRVGTDPEMIPRKPMVSVPYASASQKAQETADTDSDTKVQAEESPDEDKIRFDTRGVERMIIDEQGKVGIGTTTPAAQLHVKGNYEDNDGIRVTNLATQTPALGFFSKSDSRWGICSSTGWGDLNITQYDGSWNRIGVRFIIRENGNVGIGKTDPQRKLDVNGSSIIRGQLDLNLNRLTNLATPTASSDAATRGYVDGALAAGDNDWQIVGSDVITGHGGDYPSGRVGIGTSPKEKLHVAGTSLFQGYMKIRHGSAPAYGSRIIFEDDSEVRTAMIDVWAQGLALRSYVTGKAIDFLTKDAGDTYPVRRMRIDADGKVAIGLSIPSTKLDVNGTITATGGNSNDWNQAYGWGNHATAGYLTSETDPVFSSSAASGITATNINNWNTAFGWGNHALAGYLTTESDPQVGANATNYVPRWNGFALVQGTIYDNGNIGIGASDPTHKLTVQGDIKHINSSGQTLCFIAEGTDGSGNISTYGPNGNLNIWLKSHSQHADYGLIEVADNNGTIQAGMYVNNEGEGRVWADIKNFRMSNPNEPGTEIWYACPEGPEAAAYVRGTAHLTNGKAEIVLADHFKAVASPDGITVQLTPLSAESKGLAVVKKGLDQLVVRELDNGNGTYDFDFLVMAVRKGYEDYQVIRPVSEVQPAEGHEGTQPSVD